MGAQYSGYIEFKAKGAPLAFVFPETGVPAVPETYGIVDRRPASQRRRAVHGLVPGAGRPAGAGRGVAAAFAARRRAGARRGSVPLKDMKLLFPADWNAFEKDRPDFAKEWDRIVGARR